MIRIICRETDNAACAVGGQAHSKFKTFDIELPELEKWFRDRGADISMEVLGAEIITPEAAKPNGI